MWKGLPVKGASGLENVSMRRAIALALVIIGALGLLGFLSLAFDPGGEAPTFATAADSCVYKGGPTTAADRQNARAIVEADPDRMFALALHDGHWAHTYSRAFGTNLDSTHCVTGLNYSLDGGTRSVTFHVALNMQRVVGVR